MKVFNQISRRTFLSQTINGTGAAMLSGVVGPFISTTFAKSKQQTLKKLFATSDFACNLYDGKFLDRKQIDDLHANIASLGVTRHNWIVDSVWTLYEDYPKNFDLLSEAVKSAHAHGIELYAEIKNFEDGGYHIFIPHTMPFPKDAVAFKDMRGINLLARPFAARHPEMSMKRRPGTYEFKGPITTVRLVKDDNSPTSIESKHLSIWTSSTNNQFVEYKGPVSFRETVEWRPCFPKWKKCRILHFENLKIPQDHAYVLVRCSKTNEQGEFSNENGKIIELVGPDGRNIPYILGKEQISLERHNKELYHSKVGTQLIRYLKLPEVQEEIKDPVKMQKHYDNFFLFDEYYKPTSRRSLDKDGFIVAACGKPEYMLGNLHPIYPEVREHWLNIVRFCLDRGVDGINIRMANHTRSPEYWEYGFNEPVLEAAGGRTDYPTISKLGGDAYTQFLRETKTLVKNKAKGLTLHLHAGMLMPDDRGGNRFTSLPPNIEWQWQTWINEIADDLEFRGAFKLRPWNLQKVLDTFSAATRAVNIPLYFQSDFHTLPDEGRALRLRHEIDTVKNNDDLEGLVLYETANFTHLNKNNGVELKPYIGKVIKENYAL